VQQSGTSSALGIADRLLLLATERDDQAVVELPTLIAP